MSRPRVKFKPLLAERIDTGVPFAATVGEHLLHLMRVRGAREVLVTSYRIKTITAVVLHSEHAGFPVGEVISLPGKQMVQPVGFTLAFD